MSHRSTGVLAKVGEGQNHEQKWGKCRVVDHGLRAARKKMHAYVYVATEIWGISLFPAKKHSACMLKNREIRRDHP
jgi:hypothetical protein